MGQNRHLSRPGPPEAELTVRPAPCTQAVSAAQLSPGPALGPLGRPGPWSWPPPPPPWSRVSGDSGPVSEMSLPHL